MIEKRIERRRFLAGGMVVLGAALLAGCAGKPGGEESRDGQSPAEETAVTVLMPGPAARKDKTRSSGFSALTRERLGFSVQVEQVPRERYETTLWQRMMGPQTADLFYLPVGQSMGSSIYEDCLAPLSALLCGYLDPDEALPRFLSGLQDAGIEDILANKQRQLDDWLRAQR